jgi:hypothetical protein
MEKEEAMENREILQVRLAGRALVKIAAVTNSTLQRRVKYYYYFENKIINGKYTFILLGR